MFKLSNIKKYFSGANGFWTKVGWAAVGGAAYALIPTFIQGFSGKKADGSYKINMSGWPGLLTATGAASLIGMAADKPQMALGAMAAGAVHMLYTYGNDTVSSFSGSPIWAFDPSAKMLSDEMPPGYQTINLPDGQKVMARTGPGVSDYLNTAPQLPVPGMNDYINEMPQIPAPGNGSARMPEPQGPLMDYFNSGSDIGISDFMDAVASGNFS